MNTVRWRIAVPFVCFASLILVLNAETEFSANAAPPSVSTVSGTFDRTFFKNLLLTRDAAPIASAFGMLDANWNKAYIPLLLELAGLAVSPDTRLGAFELLGQKTGEAFDTNLHEWLHWWWNQPAVQTTDYADFKADLYALIDPQFETYFKGRQDTARIRLDEIRWGGVVQDGIPPLRGPRMIAATNATYLQDDNVVFGIEINGDARAYPKRILAWHEMFIDTIGGVEIAGVYCTLCGTVIPYKTSFEGVNYALGTSGFLYRSNKLMYDAATQSLWNTIKGEPVLGPLVDKGIRLEHLSVVTTTWGAWKRRHPNTQVLALETGYRRDYGEGAAYKAYFATDQLMFNTPYNDTRLKNKQEVLALRFAGAPEEQLAIDTEFLRANPVYYDSVGLQQIVVLTDSSGANRVYDPAGVTMDHYDGDSTVVDETGTAWTVTEAALIATDGRSLARLPYHRAFWFGWHATFPDTRLVTSATRVNGQ